mmetsp:Transcript_54483/g.145440  ORF Transcript_54483/g.145440 Transcript_54483/m.145440 type:complete len:208 (-) Transcript_54483:1340-1963(-)
MDPLEDRVEAEFQDDGVANQSKPTHQGLLILHVIHLQNLFAEKSTILAVELVVHPRPERVGGRGDVVRPFPPDRNVLPWHHVASKEHEHPKNSGGNSHPDNVVGLEGAHQMHPRLGNYHHQHKVHEEPEEPVEFCHAHNARGRQHGDDYNSGEAGEIIGDDIGQCGNVSVTLFSLEGIPLLHEKRKHRNGHEDLKGLHREYARDERH